MATTVDQLIDAALSIKTTDQSTLPRFVVFALLCLPHRVKVYCQQIGTKQYYLLEGDYNSANLIKSYQQTHQDNSLVVLDSMVNLLVEGDCWFILSIESGAGKAKHQPLAFGSTWKSFHYASVLPKPEEPNPGLSVSIEAGPGVGMITGNKVNELLERLNDSNRKNVNVDDLVEKQVASVKLEPYVPLEDVEIQSRGKAVTGYAPAKSAIPLTSDVFYDWLWEGVQPLELSAWHGLLKKTLEFYKTSGAIVHVNVPTYKTSQQYFSHLWHVFSKV